MAEKGTEGLVDVSDVCQDGPSWRSRKKEEEKNKKNETNKKKEKEKKKGRDNSPCPTAIPQSSSFGQCP
jgi:hypothetical protein